MPMTVIRVRGSVRHMRPLPSDSTTATVPVAATAALAPEIATGTRRNVSRRCRRAASASAAGSSDTSPAPGRCSRKMSRISRRLRWIAGTRMWLCRSPPSCTMSSARSVSCASIPASCNAGFSSSSSVRSDLTLMTSSLPVAATRSTTIRCAAALSGAQWTTPPAARTFPSSSTRRSSSRRSARSRAAAPSSRRSSQSSTSATTPPRLARMAVVAWPRFARSCSSCRVTFAAFGKSCGTSGQRAVTGPPPSDGRHGRRRDGRRSHGRRRARSPDHLRRMGDTADGGTAGGPTAGGADGHRTTSSVGASRRASSSRTPARISA
ncbi:unannotated protein [freshwater metagenome]|uniref:Unannotated protein n=1 Tax=freshwater metagenome TaxID=449393 RepID=A0A6J7I7Q7_9ZZZZ